MTREQLLEERCARFKNLIQHLSFYINDRTPMVERAYEWVGRGRITCNDARYLCDLPEIEMRQVTKPPLALCLETFGTESGRKN